MCTRACCRRASSDIYYRAASTAQHSTAANPTSRKASTHRSERDNAQHSTAVGSSQHVVGHFIQQFAQFSKKRTKKSTSARLAFQKSQQLTTRLSWCDARRVCLCTQLFLSMNTASGSFSWTMELSPCVSRQCAPKP